MKAASLPKADARGHSPAVAYARASLARKTIKGRRLAGLGQAELARRAGIRPETLNRLEKGHTTPDVATLAKIERALQSAQHRNLVVMPYKVSF
jgi:DNA-binding XRE family transcriptional regulator